MMEPTVCAIRLKEKAINPRTGKRTLTKWRVKVNFGGRKDANGRPIPPKELKVNGGSEAEAIQAGYDWLRDHEGVTDHKGGTALFATFADEWMRSRAESGELATTTVERYQDIVRDLCTQLGAIPLESIDPATVERAYSAIRAAKAARSGSDPAPRTMLKIHIVMSQIMQRAEDWGRIARNPCSKVKAPRVEETNRHSLTTAQAAQLLGMLDDAIQEGYEAYRVKETHLKETGHQNKARSSVRGLSAISYPLATELALATGMRRGEVMGLTWRNVSLSNGLLKVEATQDAHGTLKAPKTAAGRRTVAIDAHTVAALEVWADFLRGVLADLGIIGRGEPLPGDVPVICSNSLCHVRLEAFSRWFREWADSNSFPGLLFHELRHTQATQLLANGVDVKTVQTRMGHADPSITLAWYAHAVPENDRRAADLFGRMLEDAGKEAMEAPILKVV